MAVLVTVCATGLLMLLFVPVLYCHPMAGDDYENSVWDSFWAVQQHLYIHWSGRYFNNLVLPLNPWHWRSLTGYRALIASIMAGVLLSYGWLISEALRRFTDARFTVRTAISAATMLLFANNAHSLAEAFYWYSGAATYMLPAIPIALFPVAIMRKMRFAAAVLVIPAIGGNEVSMLACDALCGCLLLYHWRKDKADARYYFWLCGVCLLFTTVAVAAPGNFVRASTYHHDWGAATAGWLGFSMRIGWSWVTDPYFLCFSVVVLTLFGHCRLRRPQIGLLPAFAIPFALLLLLSAPGHFALGSFPPPRVYNLIYLFFLPGWLYLLLRLSALSQKRIKAATVAIVLLPLSLWMHGFRESNFLIIALGLREEAMRKYSDAQHHRYALIKAANALDTVYVPRLPQSWHNVLRLEDIGAMPEARMNRRYAEYWQRAGIAISADGFR